MLVCLVLWPERLPAATADAESVASAAEYAVRWSVRDGGPQTAETTVKALNRQADDVDTFEVRYFDFAPPDDAPPGFTPILRQRLKGKKYELTFKYRGDRPLSTWRCPISATPDETKEEVDVSITSSGESKRAYSYSCSVEKKEQPPEIPDALKAQPKKCVSRMTRTKAEKLKIEVWELPESIMIIEVSRNGLDTPEDLSAFQAQIAKPLIQAGIKPSDRSKTELGTNCD